MMPRTNLVRPSRDGDQFHYLWAARRCLQLLSTQSDLVAISIEGSSPEERASIPALRAGEEVIDIGEYSGSEDIENARLVRYMQLKHSTLHATEPWTASGLENTLKGFAKRYQELLQTFSIDSLASKFEFWFVTNRPIATNFAEAVTDAAAGALPRHQDELQKLERFTGLSGDVLTAFAKLLHFEDRQDDYWDQRNILFQDVSGYLPDTDFDAPTRLKELVTRRALSEGEKNPTITKMDVLRALNTDESLLFPANCLIKTLDTAVPRGQEHDLVREILGARVPVIVHASAGVGKTVFATRIALGLPHGSRCILYDCFGNGQYRNASGYRHRHKDALVQIANELAMRGLCHLLIPTPHADASAYVRAFVHRVTQAATLLRLSNPNALLCIVVDAADNAQMAAEEIGESRSFVRDLIREKMPEPVRLVFLCRSHRQAGLHAPVEAIRRELLPFSRDETAAYLRQRFPDASENDIDEFHRLSSHNPRVQALALSRDNPLPDTLRLLGPNPTTVEDTIGSLLESAIAQLKDSVGPVEKAQLDRICAGLAALRPLIPIPILSKISGVEQAAIRSFAIDLGRPLLVAGDTIQFFDEPAETWFREAFP
jgi:NACHT domain-containing protein